jgi:hypothetical protein
MAKRKPSRWASQAAQEAIVRFGPEESGLRELQNTIQQTLATDISAAHGAGTNIINSIDQAAPAIRQVYDQAGLDQAGIASGLRQDTAGLGDVARTVKGAIAVEGARAANNIVGQRTAALTDLSQRRVAARAGENWQVQKARSTFATDLAKVLQRKIDLAREKGAFTAQTEGDLTQAQRDRDLKVKLENAGNQQSERNSLRTAGIDPNTGKPIKNGPLDPSSPRYKSKGGSGKDKATKASLSAARDAVQKGLAALGTLDPDKTARHDTAPLLVTGHKGQPIYDRVKGPTGATKQQPRLTRAGTPLVTPDIPSVGQWATIAADVYYDGHVSRENQVKLNRAGYSVKDLGLPTYGEWKRNQPSAGAARGRKRSLTAVAQALSGAVGSTPRLHG